MQNHHLLELQQKLCGTLCTIIYQFYWKHQSLIMVHMALKSFF